MSDATPRINGETYFFRDHGQFDLLRLRLLPELIERRRDSKVLRLWSAGCASGEEAYSLAMTLDMLLPERAHWAISILGSDIDSTALSKARRGRYGQWSFRQAPALLRQRYFRQQGNEWVLDERIRRMVTFRVGDLIGTPLPADGREMDLIICRNVFIYFSVETVSVVAEKLADALGDGGYLMTGHTELIGHRLPNLQSRLFVEGVVYQRIVPSRAEAQPVARVASQPVLPRRVPTPLPPTPPMAATNPTEMLATARNFADQGEYARAEESCRRVLAIAPLSAEPYFLLAQLAQLRGDFAKAGELLEKTLYLDPQCVAAYLELAALCERTDNLPRMQHLRRTALDIVRTLPADRMIDPYETTAAEMAQWLAQ